MHLIVRVGMVHPPGGLVCKTNVPYWILPKRGALLGARPGDKLQVHLEGQSSDECQLLVQESWHELHVGFCCRAASPQCREVLQDHQPASFQSVRPILRGSGRASSQMQCSRLKDVHGHGGVKVEYTLLDIARICGLCLLAGDRSLGRKKSGALYTRGFSLAADGNGLDLPRFLREPQGT
jgi:hypothetical protein